MQYLFALAIAPIIFLLGYIKKKDPNPEPKDLLKKIFIFGCLTVIPVLIFEGLYDFLFIPEGTETETFMDVFLGVAFIEEFFKWIVVYCLCFKSRHFDETYDAIVYSAYSSLAFACVENVLYVFLGGGIVGILRAITAVPGHLCHSIVMGYFVGKARLAKSQGKSAFPLLFCSLLLSTLTHCIYDYFLEIEAIFSWLCFFIALVVVCIIVVKHSAKNNIAISDGTTAPAMTTPTITTVPSTPSPTSSPNPVTPPAPVAPTPSVTPTPPATETQPNPPSEKQ